MTGFGHAFNLVLYNLVTEMGSELVPGAFNLMTRADIWLRMVQSGGLNPVPSSNVGSPLYTEGGPETRSLF
jgi:hypothetical protein